MFQVPPSIVDKETSTDMVVREASNATLICKAAGYPEPYVMWRREDGDDINYNGDTGMVIIVVIAIIIIIVVMTRWYYRDNDELGFITLKRHAHAPYRVVTRAGIRVVTTYLSFLFPSHRFVSFKKLVRHYRWSRNHLKCKESHLLFNYDWKS